MSLIHQALKKIDTSRNGPRGTAATAAAEPNKGGRFGKPSPLITALFAVAVAAGAALSLHSYGVIDVGALREVVTVSKPPARAGGTASAQGQAPAEKIAPQAVKALPETKAGGTALKSTPADHNARGMELYRAGVFKDAAREFMLALAMDAADGDRAVYHNNLALAEVSSGDTASAVKNLDAALSLRPGYPEALNNYGTILASRGELSGAERYLRKAVDIDASFADAHLNLAVVLERSGKVEGAVRHYEKYVEHAPSDADPQAVRGIRARIIHLNSVLLSRRASGG